MKIKVETKFEPCPEFTGKAVCVDVTPLRKQQSQYGERNVFKLVFEVDATKEDGHRFAVWSPNFTPTLNEKSTLRKFLRGWFGRDLAEGELQEFDTESLIGRPAQLVVVHQHKDGETYANIAACLPDKSGNPLKPSGKFTRYKDKQAQPAPTGPGTSANGETGGGNGGYQRAQQPANDGGETDYAATKVHVGKYKGIELRDLNVEAVEALCEKWLPGAKANAKPTADDKRLMAALESWLSEVPAEEPAEY